MLERIVLLTPAVFAAVGVIGLMLSARVINRADREARERAREDRS